MSDYTRGELDKLIENQDVRLHAKVNELRLRHVHRERIEAELISLKEEIKGIEELIAALTRTRDEDADRDIMQGLKLQKRRKTRGRKPYDKLGCS